MLATKGARSSCMFWQISSASVSAAFRICDLVALIFGRRSVLPVTPAYALPALAAATAEVTMLFMASSLVRVAPWLMVFCRVSLVLIALRCDLQVEIMPAIMVLGVHTELKEDKTWSVVSIMFS